MLGALFADGGEVRRFGLDARDTAAPPCSPSSSLCIELDEFVLAIHAPCAAKDAADGADAAAATTPEGAGGSSRCFSERGTDANAAFKASRCTLDNDSRGTAGAAAMDTSAFAPGDKLLLRVPPLSLHAFNKKTQNESDDAQSRSIIRNGDFDLPVSAMLGTFNAHVRVPVRFAATVGCIRRSPFGE